MDRKVFYNGTILTMQAEGHTVEAVYTIGDRIAAMAVQAYDQPISPALKPLLLNHNHNGTNHAPQINHSTNIMNDSFAVVFIF